VIPAYRAERTIVRAVDSVLAQSGCRPSVLVVIDGTVDSTEKLLKSYFGSRIRVIVHQENRGVQASRNAGLDVAEDDCVMFLDADDFLEPHTLGGLIDAVGESGANLSFAPMRVLVERSGTSGPLIRVSGSEAEIFSHWLGSGKFVGCCSVLWRTGFLRQIGGWDPNLRRQEDGEMVLRALLLGARVAHSNRGCGVYVMHKSRHRLTSRSDNLSSLLKVPAKLLALPGAQLPRSIVQQACAASYYNAAHICFVRGKETLGIAALRRARQLGLNGHRGSAPRRFLSRIFGLRTVSTIEGRLRRLAGKTA
jgi:GT2 family glycosyltransferase